MFCHYGLARLVKTYLTAVLKIALGLILFCSLAACGGAERATQTQTPGVPQTGTPSSGRATVTAPSATRTTPIPSQTVTSAAGQTRTPSTTLPSPSTTPAPALNVRPEDLEELTITFWHPWQGTQGQVLQGIVNEFNRTNRWNITVEVTAFDGFESLAEAVQAALIKGEMPDLLVGYQDQALHWDQGGRVLVDLTDYVGDPSWGFSEEEQRDFYPSFWEQDVVVTSSDGKPAAPKRIGIPLQRSGLVIFYNQSWAEALGYNNPPDTPEEFRTQACAAANANANDSDPANDGTGGWMLAALPSTTAGQEILLQPSLVLGWIEAFGGQVSRLDGKGYQFNSEEAGEALHFLKGLKDDGCAWITSNPYPGEEFAARHALFYVGSLDELADIQKAFDEADRRDEWTSLAFPGVEGEPVMVAYGPSLLVAQSTPEEQMAAWTLLQWLVYPVNQARWVAANRTLPTRISTLDFLKAEMAGDPHWAEGLGLLPYARPEPAYASWSTVRWMLGDALAQLFSDQFTIDQIPGLLENLDQLASEVFTQVR
jgi:multiple sugar transport system substrate-binding protein